MKIIERVIDNRYEGDGTVHPGDHLLFLHKLCVGIRSIEKEKISYRENAIQAKMQSRRR